MMVGVVTRKLSAKMPTMTASRTAGIVALVLSLWSIVVAAKGYSVRETFALVPVAVGVAYVVARVERGIPATMRGVETAQFGLDHAETEGPKRYVLVAHPINHFGEKVRWCLDLARAPYEETNCGGLISAYVRGRSVPWLVDRHSCSLIGNSDEVLAYLSVTHVPTLPEPARRRAAAFFARTDVSREWERVLNALGHAIQGFAYYHVLKPGAKNTSGISLTAWGAFDPLVPLLDRLVVWCAHPLLKAMIRVAFKHDDPEVIAVYERTVSRVLDDVDATLANTKYLTGPTLSYVDVAFASLMAPMLPSTLLFAQPSQWAGGRFASFDAALVKRRAELPLPLAQFEMDLLRRPSGRHVTTLYENVRSRPLWELP